MNSTSLPFPSHFNLALRSDVLSIVAGWFLEEMYATDDDLQRSTDCAYTRGCTLFGRLKNRIVQESLGGSHKWLTTANGKSNDLVFGIGGVPCRFASDSAEAPSKSAVLDTHALQMPFAEFARPGEPVRFCFVIEGGNFAQEPRVVFVGFSATDEVVCQWESDNIRRLSRVEVEELPTAVNLGKPIVTPKRRKTDVDDNNVSGAGGT